MRSVAVVGGSLAGVSAARALRDEGFDGRITVVADEDGLPYDRPPLTKSFLLGELDAAGITLLDDPAELDLDWRGGVTAAALHPARRSVELDDGTALVADAVVLATGARPRRPWPATAGVHTVRTLADSAALRAELLPGARLVVVGAGYLGAEVASSARALGLDVTVLEAGPAPLTATLGSQVAAAVTGLHERHDVALRVGVPVTGFTGGPQVTGVSLADGTVVAADVVVVAVGVVPNVEWLAGSGLDVSNGVAADEFGATAIAGVVAIGDCAAWHDPTVGHTVRIEHWTAARERAGVAVGALLSGGSRDAPRSARSGRPPYVWSEQYGIRLQIAGHPQRADTMTVEDGSLDGPEFLAVYRRAGEVVGVAAIGCAGAFIRHRKQLAAKGRP